MSAYTQQAGYLGRFLQPAAPSASNTRIRMAGSKLAQGEPKNELLFGEELWCLLWRLRRKDGEQPSLVNFNKAHIFLALSWTCIF